MMVKDEELTNRLGNMLITLREATDELKHYYMREDIESFSQIINEMEESIAAMYEVAFSIKKENNTVRLSDALICVNSTLNRILEKVQNKEFVVKEIEYVLNPMLEIAYTQFMFWAWACFDEDRMKIFLERELYRYPLNRHIEKAMISGEYKYDLSIYVTAYNNLEYTKLCLKGIYDNLPNDLKIEIILFNNGSNDGTNQFFNSIYYDKLVNVDVNCVFPGIMTKICEGKYILGISNDVIVTENSIKNMYKTINSEENIGWVVPATSNISNLQSIEATYSTLEEMLMFAKKNNVFDPKRHEERTRLCNPLTMYASETMYNMYRDSTMYMNLFLIKEHFSFPDDKCSCWLRRKKYKLILAKDAYCWHFGSVTLKNEISLSGEEEFYLNGRHAFMKAFEIDPWGTGFCWSFELFKILECNNTKETKVLGVNCGLGSNPLKVKEAIKENTGNRECQIYNITDNEVVELDLKGVSNFVEIVTTETQLRHTYKEDLFDYIIWEDPFNIEVNEVFYMEFLISNLKDKGIIAIYNPSEAIKQFYRDKKTITGEKWIIYKNQII